MRLPWQKDIIERLVPLLRAGWRFEAVGSRVRIHAPDGRWGPGVYADSPSLRKATQDAEESDIYHAGQTKAQEANEAILAEARKRAGL